MAARIFPDTQKSADQVTLSMILAHSSSETSPLAGAGGLAVSNRKGASSPMREEFAARLPARKPINLARTVLIIEAPQMR